MPLNNAPNCLHFGDITFSVTDALDGFEPQSLSVIVNWPENFTTRNNNDPPARFEIVLARAQRILRPSAACGDSQPMIAGLLQSAERHTTCKPPTHDAPD